MQKKYKKKCPNLYFFVFLKPQNVERNRKIILNETMGVLNETRGVLNEIDFGQFWQIAGQFLLLILAEFWEILGFLPRFCRWYVAHIIYHPCIIHSLLTVITRPLPTAPLADPDAAHC